MNISTKQLLIIFIPIILITVGFFYVNYLQYKPLYPEPKTKKEQISEIPIFPGDVILGKKEVPKTIVIFEDLSCAACKQQQKILDKLIEKHPNQVKVVWKGLPIKKFPFSSEKAHKYAFCVSKQNKFKEFMKLAFANSDNLRTAILEEMIKQMDLNQNRLQSCLQRNKAQQYIDRTKKLAKLLNIQSVPAVFLNGEQIKAPETLIQWETKLNLN